MELSLEVLHRDFFINFKGPKVLSLSVNNKHFHY